MKQNKRWSWTYKDKLGYQLGKEQNMQGYEVWKYWQVPVEGNGKR